MSRTKAQILTLILAAFSQAVSQDRKPEVPPGRGNHVLLAVYVVDAKNKKQPLANEYVADFIALFDKRYFPKQSAPGKTPHDEVSRFLTKNRAYRVFSGGQDLGSVTIVSPIELTCYSDSASVQVPQHFRIGQGQYALATDIEVKPHASWRRSATPSEKSEILKLAQSSFVANGVPRSAKLVVDEVAFTKTSSAGPDLLIASVSVEEANAIHRLFLIAEREGASYRTNLSQYHRTSDVADGKDDNPIGFVDQIDLDGDGIDELVTSSELYDFGWEYQIYKRMSGYWYLWYSGGGGGC